LGTAVLIDFGVAYSSTAGPQDVWTEPEGKMYFEVGSGYVVYLQKLAWFVNRCFPRPYRAPELLFGVRRYDATACDLWALGTTFAGFFTTLHRRAMASDFDDDSDADERGDPTKTYLFDELPEVWARSEWERYSLFDGSRGDIGLAWSIFRARGSPTPENWPVRFHPLASLWYFSYFIRHSPNSPTRTGSISLTRLAYICQPCYHTSMCRFLMGTHPISPLRSRNQLWLT
jgi:serine/threonine protein kinase